MQKDDQRATGTFQPVAEKPAKSTGVEFVLM
jgi:hypothetical protein